MNGRVYPIEIEKIIIFIRSVSDHGQSLWSLEYHQTTILQTHSIHDIAGINSCIKLVSSKIATSKRKKFRGRK